MSNSKFKASTFETVDATAGATNQNVDTTLVAMKEGMEKATKGLEASQVKIKEGVEKMMKTAEQMVSFSQGNMEAMIKATQIYASGVQEISKQLASSSKASLENSVAFTKTLMGVKSVKEAVDLQSGFAKSSLESAVSETNRIADASVKLAEHAMAPLTERMSKAVETFGKTV